MYGKIVSLTFVPVFTQTYTQTETKSKGTLHWNKSITLKLTTVNDCEYLVFAMSRFYPCSDFCAAHTANKIYNEIILSTKNGAVECVMLVNMLHSLLTEILNDTRTVKLNHVTNYNEMKRKITRLSFVFHTLPVYTFTADDDDDDDGTVTRPDEWITSVGGAWIAAGQVAGAH